MGQLVFMFSYITGKPTEEARNIILETDAGKAVQVENSAVMYEQQTENISRIAMELRDHKPYAALAELFTVSKIVQSMKALKSMEKQGKKSSVVESIVIAKKPELKERDRLQKQAARKNVLQIKKQNAMNSRRIKHADQSQG